MAAVASKESIQPNRCGSQFGGKKRKKFDLTKRFGVKRGRLEIESEEINKLEQGIAKVLSMGFERYYKIIELFTDKYRAGYYENSTAPSSSTAINCQPWRSACTIIKANYSLNNNKAISAVQFT